MKKLNITFCSFPDFGSNAKPLYDYFKKHNNNRFNLSWVVRTDDSYEKLKKNKINVYKLGTKEYFSYIKTSNIIFSTHADITGDKPDGSLYIELWHGISSKHIGFLSDNISDSDEIWFNDVKEKVDYFIVPSEFWRVIFSVRFNVRYNRVLSLGYPKLDCFLENKCNGKLEKVVGCDIEKFNKVIYYMPTFRKGCSRKLESSINLKNILNLKTYDEHILINYLEKNNYLLCIKKHPSEELSFNVINNDHIKLISDADLESNNFNLNQILNAADLLITDYSSLGIEFLYLNKPVIYIINDIEQYKKNRGIVFNNYEFWMPGFRINDINSLTASIDNCFSNNYLYKDLANYKRQLWFGDIKNGGCDKILNYFIDSTGKIKNNIVLYKSIVFENQKLKNDINLLNDNVTNLKENIVELNNCIDNKLAKIYELESRLDEINNSKTWKLLEKLRYLKRYIINLLKFRRNK